jgi:cysteinyl-tRNA synthetase
MHNEMLQVEGKKMSKSLGNFFTVRDLLDDGVPGEVIRFVMLSTHYRKPMDWTEKKRQEAEKTLLSWIRTIDLERDAVAQAVTGMNPPEVVVAALSNDLNTHLALAEMMQLGKAAKSGFEAKVQLAEAMVFLGFDYTEDWIVPHGSSLDKLLPDGTDLIAYETALKIVRAKAMQSKDFAELDAMKNMLIAAGVTVQMSRDTIEIDAGPDFDSSKLDALK